MPYWILVDADSKKLEKSGNNLLVIEENTLEDAVDSFQQEYPRIKILKCMVSEVTLILGSKEVIICQTN